MIEITYKDTNGNEHTVMAVSAEVSVPTQFETRDHAGEVVVVDEAHLEHHFSDTSVSVEVWVWGADVGKRIHNLYSYLTERIVQEGEAAPDSPEHNWEAEAHAARYEAPHDDEGYVSYYEDNRSYDGDDEPSTDDGLDGYTNDIYPDVDDLLVPTDFGDSQ